MLDQKATLTMTLHDSKELDDDLRGRTDEDLALATALGVDNVVLPRMSETGRVYEPGDAPGSH